MRLARHGQFDRFYETHLRLFIGNMPLTALYQRIQVLAREGSLSAAQDYAESEPLPEALHAVPFRTTTLVVNQHRFSTSGESREHVGDPAQLLLKSKTTFSLLVGYAGFGKTTATVRIASHPRVRTFFIPAASITNLTTTDILKHCVDLDRALEDLAPEDRPVLSRAAALAFQHFFKLDDGSALLLIDGLDESLRATERGGLQRLLNALANAGQLPESNLSTMLLNSRSKRWHGPLPA